ncbi:MAG: tetratricopeptide repeat protein [Mycolicibacterium cosmeticum]|nr:tetratricopeptide repeat protein [Mycolicibacterium cosmeticum]
MATVTEKTTEKTTEHDEDVTDEDLTPDATEPEDTAEPEDTTEETPKPGRSRRILAAALALIYLVTLGGCGFLGWQLWQQHQVARAGDDARQAAVTYAQILTSIDSGKVDENFAQVLDGATGEFKDMYSQSSVQLRQLLIDNKAAAHGIVTESAVQSATKDKVVVLLFVDQSVQNTNVPDPRIDRSRVKMTMEYVDGRWRAAKVELP